MGAYPGNDSVRLLRAINAQQALGRVGSVVLPSDAARAAAWSRAANAMRMPFGGCW